MMRLQYASQPAEPSPAAPLSAEQVFRLHVPRLYSLARRMMGNDVDAEDVVGDVLVVVLRKLDGFRGEAKLSTWLHRITVNAALMHRRKKARLRERQAAALRAEAGLCSSGSRPQAPDQRALEDEWRQLVEGAIAALPQTCRDVLVLADVERLPNVEIAELLGLSLSAVKSRLHRARLLLRQALAAYGSLAEGAAAAGSHPERKSRVLPV